MPNWTKEQSDAIYKSGTNIIVSAGAGSGKTAVLSERVLQKALSGIDVDKLLVLTFTNAAAREMKDRIRKKLKQNNLNDQLIKLDRAYITTFDSYALSLVKKYHYLLNISNKISICEQSIMNIKKQEILDEIFLSMYDNSDFLKLIDDFCTKDDAEIKEYILNINNKLDMIYKKEEYLNNYVNEYYSDSFITDRINEYISLLFNKIDLIRGELINLEECVDNEYYLKVTELLSNLFLSKNYEDIKLSIVKLPNLPRNSDEDAKVIKSRITEYLKDITNMTSYNDTNEIKESILNTKKYVKVIIEIINKFDTKLNEYKFKNDLYEFIDINKMAIKLLEEHKSVREELNYNEILIDEYQDTNDLQDLFISFIENNNVYMVGDIKQSIYRFRNANPNLFKNKYDNYEKNNGGIKIDLNKNFRSREEVLNNINTIFEIVMDNVIGGADYKASHKMTYGNLKYSNEGKLDNDFNMEILNYDIDQEYKKEEIEIFTIATDIKKKIESGYLIYDKDEEVVRKLEYKDIVILMDRATNFELYKKIFEYLSIPLTLYKDELINDNIDISIIKNIIGFMITDNEVTKKYCFMSILRSYLFRVDDQQIFKYITNNDFSFLNNYLIETDNITPKDMIEYIIDKYDFYNNIIKVGNIDSHIAIIDYLIDLADSLTNIGYDINDFYDYLDSVTSGKVDIKYTINNTDNNSVKIMTIHKSKGLEYHICYFSGLYAKFNISDLKEKFVYDNKLGIITPIIDNGIRNTIYKDLLKNNYIIDEISEKVRLFYVGLTRAKEKMIIVMPSSDTDIKLDLSTKMNYKSFADIIYSIRSSLSLYIKKIDINSINITHNYNLIKKSNYKDKIEETKDKIKINSINIDSHLIEKKHFSKENHKLYSKEDYNNIEFGKHIHSVFENIDFMNPNYDDLDNFSKEKVSKFIDTGLFNSIVNIYKEYEFIYECDNNELHGFIDLLLEYENEYKIIDYKLKNIQDDAYKKQLLGYKKYIENITGKSVKTYLYSIIDEKLIEIV